MLCLQNKEYEFTGSVLLVKEHKVWNPNLLRFDPEGVDVTVLVGVPGQLVVVPVLATRAVTGTTGRNKRN